ncbi:MAG TPA: hypothetical protein PLM75_10775 [bacterium]|nr:hypothetical protein [bacterium]HPP88329.1 hypothetical protein [bacterium]
MQKKNFLLILILLMPIVVFGNQKKYIKTNNTKLYETASAAARVVKKLNKDEEVIVLKKVNRFFEVETNDKKRGFVFEFSLVDNLPQQQKGAGVLANLTTDNYASRDSATRANVRGLTEMSKQYAVNNKISKSVVDTVIEMENYYIPLEIIDEFMKIGRIGEYAE